MKNIVRTTKHILKFANKEKAIYLEKLYQDYKIALQECIDLIYNEELPLKTLLSSSKLPQTIGNIKHSRWKSLIYRQASEIVRGTKESNEYQRRQKYKKVYKYFFKRNRQLKFLQKHFYELNLKKFKKPLVKDVSIVMDYRFTDFKVGNSFNEFMKLSLPYFIEGKRNSIKIKLPIKHTKLDNKYKEWKRRDSVVVQKINNQFYVNYIYEKELSENKTEGISLGIDFGMNKLLSTSRQEFLGTDIENICKELTSCKRGSKHYQSVLRKRNQYIDKTVKELNLDNVKTIYVEDLKDLKRNGKKIGKTKKSFRNNFQYVLQIRTFERLKNICEEQGISLVKVSPAYTSQTCSRCGTIDKSSRNDEIYHCKTCDLVIDADYNAAINILHRGVYSPSDIHELKI